jgi:hypothetical protein
MMDKFSKMINLMRDLVHWEHQTLLSLQHGEDAKLVTGGQDLRASIILWRKCIDITDLLKVSQAGAAAGASGKSGSAAEVDAEALAGMRLRTAGEVMQASARLRTSVSACVEYLLTPYL